jgi:hypothetical protein
MSDWRFEIAEELPDAWQALTATDIGGDTGSTDLFVLAERGGERRRFDLRYLEVDDRGKAQAIFWQGWFAFGFGSRALLLREQGGAPLGVGLGCYFEEFITGEDYLLAISGQGIVRLDAAGAVVWRNDALAVDGVIVFDVEDGAIDGQGEWDPPGGWRDFLVSLETGETLPPEDDEENDLGSED